MTAKLLYKKLGVSGYELQSCAAPFGRFGYWFLTLNS